MYKRQEIGTGEFGADMKVELVNDGPVTICMDKMCIRDSIPGKRSDEYVIVGAHFDHLGVDETLADDKIYNGADDNADVYKRQTRISWCLPSWWIFLSNTCVFSKASCSFTKRLAALSKKVS